MENTMKMYITADEVAELLGVSRGYERFIFKIQNCAHRGRTGTGEKRISGKTRSAGEISVVMLP